MDDVRHHWVRGVTAADRAEATARLELPPLLARVDAHRALRGPYTAAGSLLRALVPQALARSAEVVTPFDVEILAAAPELRPAMPWARETLTSMAVLDERTRFYSQLRTQRIANGLVDFLLAYVGLLGQPATLVIDNLHEADATDREWAATLVRRADPAVLTVVVTTDTSSLDEPPGRVILALKPALTAGCRIIDAPDPTSRPNAVDDSEVNDADVARAYVESDGTSDDPAEFGAYLDLAPDRRAALHDARYARLAATGEKSLTLGALCWHAERGSDPNGTGVETLRAALIHCVNHAFYHAAIDLGRRALALLPIGGSSDDDGIASNDDTELDHWAIVTRMTTALTALGRTTESLALYEQTGGRTTQPTIQMQLAYSMAMLYTRHFEPALRDHEHAKRWINQAVAIAWLIPDPKERAFSLAFSRNGLALIEVHLDRPKPALRLLDESIAHLEDTVGPDEHALHRSALRFNRAQVHSRLGNIEAAMADYASVIDADPNYPEYRFDRGILARRLGRDKAALDDFDRTIAISPPFPEAFYNRGDVRAALGDVDGAIADFARVIELDPTFVDAYVNRASLYADLGQAELSWRDIHSGLTVQPGHPHLTCLSGRLHAEQGRIPEAIEAYSAAIAADSGLAAAWAGRGAAAYESGDLAGAVADLRRAAELTEDPDVHFNLAALQEAAG